MKSENRNLKLTIVELDFFNSPIDYDLVYPEMKAKICELMVKNDITDDDKIINISSGTPTMTTCWVFLQQSGVIPKAKLVQGYPKKYAQRIGKNVDEVKFDTANFPKVETGTITEAQLENNIKKARSVVMETWRKELNLVRMSTEYVGRMTLWSSRLSAFNN